MSHEHSSEAATKSTESAEGNVLSGHDCEIPTASQEVASPTNVDGKLNDTTVLQHPFLQDADAQIQEKTKEEEEEEDIYAALQEDEETRSYMPDYIEQLLENPPPIPGVNSSDLRRMFNDICDCMPPHRPKSDLEFYKAYMAAVATLRVFSLDRLSPNLVKIHQRSAAEALHVTLQAVVPPTKKHKQDLERHAKEAAMDYFADPAYRTKFNESLELGGLGAEAVETEAFKRALPSLAVTERMRKSAIKEREQALNYLKEAYALRDPEERMPLSMAARRRFYKEVAEDKKLAQEERLLEEAKKAAENGHP